MRRVNDSAGRTSINISLGEVTSRLATVSGSTHPFRGAHVRPAETLRFIYINVPALYHHLILYSKDCFLFILLLCPCLS